MEGESFGNSLVNGLKGAAVDAAFGGLTGGVTGGVKAHNQNLNVLDGSEKKVYTGYFGFDNKGTVRYVGITSRDDPNIRFTEHFNSKTDRALLYYESQRNFNSRLEARIWEQTKINLYGMKKYGGLLLNKRNEIARKYWNLYGIKP